MKSFKFLLRKQSTLGRVSVLLFILLLSVGVTAEAKTKESNDPNHQGWQLKKRVVTPVTWKKRQAKCPQCQTIVGQYNAAMEQLFDVRYRLESLNAEHDAERKALLDRMKYYFDKRNKPENQIAESEEDQTVKTGLAPLRINAADARLIALMNDQQDQLSQAYRNLKKSLNNSILAIEKQVRYLQWAMAECEREFCKVKGKPKDKKIKVGGENVKGNFHPDIKTIFKENSSFWPGEYKTHCRKCLSIVKEINQVPGWLIRAHFDAERTGLALRNYDNNESYEFARQHISNRALKGRESIAKIHRQNLAKIEKLIEKYRELIKELSECERQYCPKVGLYAPEPMYQCAASNEVEPITVGANNDVGSSANFKEKAAKKAKGLALGALAKVTGLGGGGGGNTDPGTVKDPVKKKYKTKVTEKKPKRTIRVGGRAGDDGLIISSDIDKWPGKGTFHTIYLQNPRGWKIMPIGYYLYEIWRNWKLNVSWTQKTYHDGVLVDTQTGGWTETWSEKIGEGKETIYGEVPQAPIWEQLGFNTATSGVKSLGSLFPVSAEMLATEKLSLVVHVSNPKEDPVTTKPYVFDVALGDKGWLELTPAETTVANVEEPCEAYTVAGYNPDPVETVKSLVDDPTSEVGAAYINSIDELAEELYLLSLYGGGTDVISAGYGQALGNHLGLTEETQPTADVLSYPELKNEVLSSAFAEMMIPPFEPGGFELIHIGDVGNSEFVGSEADVPNASNPYGTTRAPNINDLFTTTDAKPASNELSDEQKARLEDMQGLMNRLLEDTTTQSSDAKPATNELSDEQKARLEDMQGLMNRLLEDTTTQSSDAKPATNELSDEQKARLEDMQGLMNRLLEDNTNQSSDAKPATNELSDAQKARLQDMQGLMNRLLEDNTNQSSDAKPATNELSDAQKARLQDMHGLMSRLSENDTNQSVEISNSSSKKSNAQTVFDEYTDMDHWDFILPQILNWYYQDTKEYYLNDLLTADNARDRVQTANIISEKLIHDLIDYLDIPAFENNLTSSDKLELEKYLREYLRNYDFLKTYLDPNAKEEELTAARCDIYHEIAIRYYLTIKFQAYRLDQVFDEVIKNREKAGQLAESASLAQLEASAIKTELEELKATTKKQTKKTKKQQADLEQELIDKQNKAEELKNKSAEHKKKADEFWYKLPEDKRMLLGDHVRCKKEKTG